MTPSLTGQPHTDIPALALYLLQRDAPLLPASVQRAVAKWEQRKVIQLMVRALSFNQPFMILSGPPQIGKTTAMYYAQGLTAAQGAYELLREQRSERLAREQEYAALRMLDEPPQFIPQGDPVKLGDAFMRSGQERINRQWQMAREHKTPPPLGELIAESLRTFKFNHPLRAHEMASIAWDEKKMWGHWSAFPTTLYVDELGDELTSETAKRGMVSIMKARWDWRNARPTLMCTNLEKLEFMRKYGGPLGEKNQIEKRLTEVGGFMEVTA